MKGNWEEQEVWGMLWGARVNKSNHKDKQSRRGKKKCLQREKFKTEEEHKATSSKKRR